MQLLYSETIGHKNNFDFTRFVLAVLVIFTHAYFVYYGPSNALSIEPFWAITNHQIAFGTLAVNFFFIISGFLVLQSLTHSKNYFSFLKKRVLRIYPAFVTVILFCAFIAAPLGNGTASHPFQNFREYWPQISIRHLASVCLYLKEDIYFLPETFKNLPSANDLNTSIWTIHLEFACYLVLLGLGILRAFKLHKLIPLALFLLILFFNIIHFNIYAVYNSEGTFDTSQIPYFPQNHFEDFLNMEHLLVFFMSGACFYYYREYIPRSKYLLIFSIIAVIIAMRWIKVLELAQSVFGAYLLFYMIFSKSFKLYNFAKYGDFSYGIYLFGWPVQQLVMTYFGSKLSLFESLFISLLLIIFMAFLSWHLVEKQALSFKNKKLNFDWYNKIKMLRTKK